MNGYYDAVVRILKQHGYTLLRQGKGAHEIWSNGKRNQVLSRNMPAKQMANAIMKQAGLDHRF